MTDTSSKHILPQQINLAITTYDTATHTYDCIEPPFGFVLLHLNKDDAKWNELHKQTDKHNLHCLRQQIQLDYTTHELIELTNNSHITVENVRFCMHDTIVPVETEQDCILDETTKTVFITPDPTTITQTSPLTSLTLMHNERNNTTHNNNNTLSVQQLQLPIRHETISYTSDIHTFDDPLQSHNTLDNLSIPSDTTLNNIPPTNMYHNAKAPPVQYESDDDEPSTTSMYQPHLHRSQTIQDGSKLKITITGINTQQDTVHHNTNEIHSIKYMYSVKELLNSEYCASTQKLQSPIWISIENASVSDYEIIGRSYGLHPLTIEDCQTHSTREKLEIFTNYLFLVLHALDNRDRPDTFEDNTSFMIDDELNDSVDEIFPTTPIRLIVFSNIILSFHHSDILTVDVVRRRLYRIYNNYIETTSWLIHAMLDCIVDSLLPVVESTSYEVDALDDLIYILTGSEHRDLLRRMGLTRRRLLFLRQRLWSKRDILMSLIGQDWQLVYQNNNGSSNSTIQVAYMRDVYDHVVTMLHKIDSASDLLQTLQSTYLANVSIDVSDASQRTNNTVKRLTAVVTIVSPLTLIAGLQGMNVEVPFQHQTINTAASLTPYIVIISSFAAFMIGSLSYLKHKRLL